MSTRFETLFEVRVAHSYYTKSCEDLGFVIPADTSSLLKNGKLLAREVDGKLTVLFEAGATGVASRPIPGERLRFGLRLRNPFFSNFTELAAGPDTPPNLFYRNTAAPAALDPAGNVRLTGRILNHKLVRKARPLTVNLKDNTGAVRQTDEIGAAVSRTSISYDLTGEDPNLYSIEEIDADGTTPSLYYLDAELVAAGVFGVIDVKIDDGFYTAPPEFKIAFEAREETLRYYVVARKFSDDEIAQLSVVDAGFGDDGRPQVSFGDPVASTSFTGAEKALLADPLAKVVRFASNARIARTQKPRKKIQLRKNGTALIAHLPQPRPQDSNADLIIPVSKP